MSYTEYTVCVYESGTREWYLNDEKMSETEFNQRMNSCSGKIVKIDGVKYKLQEI